MGAKSLTRPPTRLYEEDFVLWSDETARLLRERRFDEIDLENLIEEVEAIARRDRQELMSRMTVVLLHLLKWQHQPRRRSRTWQLTLATQRREIRYVLERSPSLKRIPQESLAQAYRDAVKEAAIETGLPSRSFPAECPYTTAQILDSDFLPAR
jgi:Domain of unknown function DUF29